MAIFATAGGGGEAYDLCFFCPAFVFMLGTVVAAVVAVARGSVGAGVTAVSLAMFVGAVVLYAAATLEPSDDPDERGSQEMMRSAVGWWAASAAVAGASAAWVAIRRLRRRGPRRSGPSPEPGSGRV